MSFLYNWGWLGLLVPFALLVGYLLRERNDNVDAVKWSNLEVFQSTVKVASKKWRHTTATLLTLSMVAVVAGLLVGLPLDQQDSRSQDLRVLVVDVSESANTSLEPGGITRLQQTQGAISEVFAGCLLYTSDAADE